MLKNTIKSICISLLKYVADECLIYARIGKNKTVSSNMDYNSQRNVMNQFNQTSSDAMKVVLKAAIRKSKELN